MRAEAQGADEGCTKTFSPHREEIGPRGFEVFLVGPRQAFGKEQPHGIKPQRAGEWAGSGDIFRASRYGVPFRSLSRPRVEDLETSVPCLYPALHREDKADATTRRSLGSSPAPFPWSRACQQSARLETRRRPRILMGRLSPLGGSDTLRKPTHSKPIKPFWSRVSPAVSCVLYHSEWDQTPGREQVTPPRPANLSKKINSANPGAFSHIYHKLLVNTSRISTTFRPIRDAHQTALHLR